MALLVALAMPVSLAAQQIIPFDAPGAGTGAGQGTFGVAIIATGTIMGYYIDGSSVAHGFLRSRGGTFTTFDAPGAGTGAGQGTFPNSIIPVGAVAGNYIDASGVNHGFLRSRDGTFTTIDVTGAGTGPGQGTQAGNINPMGTIAGLYLDASNVFHGFVRAPDGAITTFDAPGADTTDAFFGTTPDFTSGLNQAGAVSGDYLDSNIVFHGFVRARNGVITTFDAPGADMTPFSGNGTIASSINPGGAIAGYFFDANVMSHGFLRAPNGTYKTFDAPGAGTIPFTGQGTYSENLNPGSEITGAVIDAGDVAHGFVRAPDGAITTFDAPGAGTISIPFCEFSGTCQGTHATCNDPAGGITGRYIDAFNVAHGYLRTP
jgi:hypothetical protein